MTSAAALLLVLFSGLMGQEWGCVGPKGALRQEEAHLDSAAWQQSSSSLRALCERSCPEEGRTSCQFLASVPELSPGVDGVGARRVRGCFDPHAGTGAPTLRPPGAVPPWQHFLSQAQLLWGCSWQQQGTWSSAAERAASPE